MLQRASCRVEEGCSGKGVCTWRCTLKKDEWKRPHKEEVRSKPLRDLGEEHSRRWEEPAPTCVRNSKEANKAKEE